MFDQWFDGLLLVGLLAVGACGVFDAAWVMVDIARVIH